MRILGLLYNSAYVIGPLLAVAATYGLVRVIGDVARARQRDTIARLPIMAEQRLTLAEAGDVMLNIEGPIGSRLPAASSFQLASETGNSVSSRRVLFRLVSAGTRTARTELLRLRIPAPGTYVLRVAGAAEPLPEPHAIVLTRPGTVAAIARVVAIVVLACVAIGSIVLIGLRVAGVGGGTPNG